ERWLGHVPFSGHRHARDVTACSLEHPRALRWKELNAWLSRIRVQHGERLLRLKGVVELEGEPLPVALHGVHHVFHPPRPLAHLKDAGLKGARVVVIAPRADAEAIASSWNRFIEEPFVVR